MVNVIKVFIGYSEPDRYTLLSDNSWKVFAHVKCEQSTGNAHLHADDDDDQKKTKRKSYTHSYTSDNEIVV